MNETRKQIIALIEPYYAEGQTEPDITALLKYTENKGCIGYRFNGDEGISIRYIDDIYTIPNKPLHLYSNEQDVQLLELLIKLKNAGSIKCKGDTRYGLQIEQNYLPKIELGTKNT